MKVPCYTAAGAAVSIYDICDLVANTIVVFIDILFVIVVAVFTVRVLIIGAPTVILDVIFFCQRHQLFHLGIDQVCVQRAFAQNIAADDHVTLFHFQLFGLGHFVAQLERFNRHFLQGFEIVCREVMLNRVQCVRIAAIFQQLFDNQTRLFTLFFRVFRFAMARSS